MEKNKQKLIQNLPMQLNWKTRCFFTVSSASIELISYESCDISKHIRAILSHIKIHL